MSTDHFEHISHQTVDGSNWTHYKCRDVYYNGHKVMNLNISDDQDDQFGIVCVNEDDQFDHHVFELDTDNVIELVTVS